MSLRASVSCQELVELASDYLDGVLPRSRRRAVERHLAGCPDCTAYIDQLRTTVALTGSLKVSDVPDDLLDVFERAWREERGQADDGA